LRTQNNAEHAMRGMRARRQAMLQEQVPPLKGGAKETF